MQKAQVEPLNQLSIFSIQFYFQFNYFKADTTKNIEEFVFNCMYHGSVKSSEVKKPRNLKEKISKNGITNYGHWTETFDLEMFSEDWDQNLILT